MKTPAQVTAEIERRLVRGWHKHLTREELVFPHSFSLGTVDVKSLREDYATVYNLTRQWQKWADDNGAELTFITKLAQGRTRQQVPKSIQVDSIEQAAKIVGSNWTQRLERGNLRLKALLTRYPQLASYSSYSRVVREIDGYKDLDFELLCTVADWFIENSSKAYGITPRQVPIPGVHAKWLQVHEAVVRELAGIDDLFLADRHPSRIHFTYLDPEHRASRRRIHDSATVGDNFTPIYQPRIVVISENKDTAINFLPLEGAISVEGMGRGGKTAASFTWLRLAPLVVYWGDMDRDGYEILNGYREDFDRDIESILMDKDTYNAYEHFGTNTDKHGNMLRAGNPKLVPCLHPEELAVYEMITSPDYQGHRRIEQERIPLAVALEKVLALQTRNLV